MSTAEDPHAIGELQRRFAQLNDDARWDALAELFTDDARFTRPSDPTRPIIGRAAILQAFKSRPAGPARRHLVANPQITQADATTVHASCYSIVLAAQDDTHGTVTLGGFHDHLIRTERGWRFQSRAGFTFFDPTAFVAHLPMHALLSELAPPAAA
jgi:3-phenylpropionate/cinnamic acid dioxygenase small subunit